ncbi:hypothetical protein D0S45_20160 [Marinifilum sp. JC120]|nr:hypothetical protein D0S45_20160 [Marinifilum sp. JC120]
MRLVFFLVMFSCIWGTVYPYESNADVLEYYMKARSEYFHEKKREKIEYVPPVPTKPAPKVPGHREGVTFWGPDNYEECIEKYVSGCKTNRAVSLTKRACSALFKNGAFMSEKSAECILKNVPDAKTTSAAVELYRMCLSKAN